MDQEEDILPRINVLLVDKDQSLVSNFLVSAMSQGELKNMIELEPMDTEERGRVELGKGRASGLLIIPEKFGSDSLEGEPVELLLLKNPSEQLLPRIAEQIVDTTALILSGLLEVFSSEIDRINAFIGEEGLTDSGISLLSVQVKDKIEGIAKYIFPPVISLKQQTMAEEEEEAGGEGAPSISVHSYILPAMAIMFLMFIANVVFNDLLRERDSKSLLRLSASPMTMSEFIWSKIVASALIGMLCTLVLVAIGRLLFGILWGNYLILLLVIFCLNILIAGFISLLYSFVKTEQQAGAVLSSVILVMALIGGSMIPIDNFPEFMQKISRLTINHWGLEAFQLTIQREPFRDLLPILAGMVAAGLLLSWISSRLIQKSLNKGLLK